MATLHTCARPYRLLRFPTSGILAAVALASADAVHADSIAISPDADATLMSTANGSQVANGSGYYFFSGRVGTNGGGTLRRGLLRFDVSQIPSGSIVKTASLQLYVTQTTSGFQPFSLHRMEASWGEGPSFDLGGNGTSPQGGDSTWSFRFWPTTPWGLPGGQFSATASASLSIEDTGFWIFPSTPALVSDVQAWIEARESNFGWTVKGNESQLQTTKKFESRESPEVDRRPLLTITFEPPPRITGDLNGDSVVDGADLGMLLGAWGGAGSGDLNGDRAIDGADLSVLLDNWSASR